MNYDNNGYNNYNGYPNNNFNNYNQMPPMNDPMQQMPPMNDPMQQMPQQPMMEQQPMMQEQPMMNNNMGGNLYDFSNDLNTNQFGYGNNNMYNQTPNKKKKVSVFALLELLIIVFLCLIIANDKGYIHIGFLDNLIPAKDKAPAEEETTPPKDEKEEEKEKEKEEGVVTDTNLVSEYSLRAYYVGNIGVDFSNLISPIFGNNTKYEDLSEDDKLQSIIMGALTIEKAYVELTDQNEFNEVFPDIASNKDYKDPIKDIRAVDAVKIETTYKMIYGETLKNRSVSTTCPIIVYNEKYKKYYLNPYCSSGELNNSINQFVYKITTTGDDYYVYTAIATFKKNPDGTYVVYKDHKLTEKYQDYTAEEFAKFQIDSTNYKDFTKYKITFSKKGEEYAFKSIEKIDK